MRGGRRRGGLAIGHGRPCGCCRKQPGTGNGAAGTSFGLPRFREARFRVRFPFGSITLRDPDVPLQVDITGWSPFEPNDADHASLPVAALEYRFTNDSASPVEAVFSWNAKNLMALGGNPQAVQATSGGFVLWCGPGKDKPHEEGTFSASVSEPGAKVNQAWFRGGWWDPLTMAWKDIVSTTPPCHRKSSRPWPPTPPQHLRHRVLGPGWHVYQLLSRRAAGGGAHGPSVA